MWEIWGMLPVMIHPGNMAFNTNYFWKVVPYNSFGENLNAVTWCFTTAGAPIQGPKPF